jgi:hypothetical protein
MIVGINSEYVPQRKLTDWMCNVNGAGFCYVGTEYLNTVQKMKKRGGWSRFPNFNADDVELKCGHEFRRSSNAERCCALWEVGSKWLLCL